VIGGLSKRLGAGGWMKVRRIFPALGVLFCAMSGIASGADAADAPAQSCFLLYEVGVGEVIREPADACRVALSPGATFKIPHALAALESGIVADAAQSMAFDGKSGGPESARRDHTLSSAVQYSVDWYFQRVADKLGLERERVYLQLFQYGNKDPGRDLKAFWSAGTLRITPEQQQDFLVRFYQQELDVSAVSAAALRKMLEQSAGAIRTPEGDRAFAKPWPKDAVVSAQSGNTLDRSGRGVRWLVGHVARGERAYVFVSCVVGASSLDANAALDLAAKALRGAEVF
jgi:beta-lactamase class D